MLTNLVINTDRRTYLLELRSTERTYMATVSWQYPEDQLIALRRQIQEADAAAPIATGIEFQSDEELARLAGDIANTIFHPTGMTRLGRDDDPMAVVDSRPRVKGIAGLRVVDAAIMPNIISGNTNAPTLMIAEKAAR